MLPKKPTSGKKAEKTKKAPTRPKSKAQLLKQEPTISEAREPELVDDSEETEDLEAYSDPVLPSIRSPEIEVLNQGSSSLPASTDPFKRYITELQRHPLLDVEEEMKLALQMRDQSQTPSMALEAAKRLVQANLRLVVKIAFEYRSIYSNLMDLIQEGNLGLMKAVSKYEPSKGVKLGYYAAWWIRSYILKYLLDNFRLVKVGTTQNQKKLFYNLLREKEKMESQGQLPGPKLLAEKLHVREKDVIEMQQRLFSPQSEVSLDSPISSSSEGRPRVLADTLETAEEPNDERIIREQLLGQLEERLPEFKKTLNLREVKILEERLLSENPKTLQEIADQFGLTRERSRQIEAELIKKLRGFFMDRTSE